MIGTIMLVFAFVFFCIGTFWNAAPPAGPWYGRFNFISAGLAVYILSILLGMPGLRR